MVIKPYTEKYSLIYPTVLNDRVLTLYAELGTELIRILTDRRNYYNKKELHSDPLYLNIEAIEYMGSKLVNS